MTVQRTNSCQGGSLTADSNLAANAPDVAGWRALVVSGDSGNCDHVSRHLRSWSVAVTMVDDSASAIAAIDSSIAASRPFDVVVIDREQPDLPGDLLCRGIRSKHRDARIGLVLMASEDAFDDVAPLAEDHAAVVICHPVRGGALLDAMKSVATERESDRGVDQDPCAETNGWAKPTPEVTRLRILVAEDNDINQAVLCTMLHQEGHHVELVGGGVEAVQAAAHGTYDVVLMDVHMPDMDGVEAAKKIRALPGSRGKVPIVATTAETTAEAQARFARAGMNGRVDKPIKKDALMAEIHRHTGIPAAPKFGAHAEPIREIAAKTEPSGGAKAALQSMLDKVNASTVSRRAS